MLFKFAAESSYFYDNALNSYKFQKTDISDGKKVCYHAALTTKLQMEEYNGIIESCGNRKGSGPSPR
jgi:hypothetical protein